MHFSLGEPEKGYVTFSYNVTHDGKITMTIFLHIPNHSATVLHALQPGWTRKGYVTFSYNVTHDGKITMTILLHIPKQSATALHAWTPTRMNQKEYVACSSNVTHDGKITMAILLRIPKQSATVLHGPQPQWTRKDMWYVPMMSRTTEKSLSRFCYIYRRTQQLYCLDFSLVEPERICNMFL